MSAVEVVTLAGDRTVVEEDELRRLEAVLAGRIRRPGGDGYDKARTVWNGMIDKRPALIASCMGTSDVVAAVNFARERNLLVSVRGGGHNYAGKSVCDGGLMIDLTPMKSVEVDPERRVARADSGLQLGELDAATQRFGLATTMGVNTDTGIAGLTLGGGNGWLAGKHALACDNLISVELVTADGRVVTASADENEDLFWAVRGAGANFGVATSFEYRLHEVGPVLGGMLMYPLSQAKQVLTFYDDFARKAPDELGGIALALADPDGNPAVAIVVCYCGEITDGEKLLQPLRSLSTPIADQIAVQPYTEMQSLFDEVWPPGRLYYNKASNICELSTGAIDVVVDYAERLPTTVSAIYFQQCHGAACRVSADATAVPHRYDHHLAGFHPAADDPADCERMIEWAKEGWESMQPFVEKAVYVNAIEDIEEEGLYRLQEAYGSNFDRLVTLKTKYDPSNFFRLNQNIAPSASEAA